MPVLGSYSADVLFEDAIGCSVASGLFDNHGTHHTCLFYGWDIGAKVDAYSAPVISFFLTPISFVLAFYDVLIVWGLMLAYVYYRKNSIQQKNTTISRLLYWVFTLVPFVLVILILASPAINRYENHELSYKMQKKAPTVSPSRPANSHSSIRF